MERAAKEIELIDNFVASDELRTKINDDIVFIDKRIDDYNKTLSEVMNLNKNNETIIKNDSVQNSKNVIEPTQTDNQNIINNTNENPRNASENPKNSSNLPTGYVVYPDQNSYSSDQYNKTKYTQEPNGNRTGVQKNSENNLNGKILY